MKLDHSVLDSGSVLDIATTRKSEDGSATISSAVSRVTLITSPSATAGGFSIHRYFDWWYFCGSLSGSVQIGTGASSTGIAGDISVGR